MPDRNRLNMWIKERVFINESSRDRICYFDHLIVHAGLGDADRAAAILRDGLTVLPGSSDMQRMYEALTTSSSETTPAEASYHGSAEDWAFGKVKLFGGNVAEMAEILGPER